MKFLYLAFSLSCLALHPVPSLHAPTMTKIIIQDVDILRTDGAADPNAAGILLAGQHYYRVERSSEGRMSWVAVKNRSDLWVKDLVTGELDHKKVSADSLRLHLFGSPEAPEVRELLVGEEIDYFSQRGARRMPDQVVDSIACAVWRLDTVGTKLQLWVDKTLNVPVQISINSQFNEYTVRYRMYVTGQPFDSTMFQLKVSRKRR